MRMTKTTYIRGGGGLGVVSHMKYMLIALYKHYGQVTDEDIHAEDLSSDPPTPTHDLHKSLTVACVLLQQDA